MQACNSNIVLDKKGLGYYGGGMSRKQHLYFRILKIAIATIILWWVFMHVGASEVDRLMQESKSLMLLAAVVSFVVSQFFAGLRMRFCLRNTTLLKPKFVVALQLIASFYDFLLPRGISGSDYKIHVISTMKLISSKEVFIKLLIEKWAHYFWLLVVALGLSCYLGHSDHVAYAQTMNNLLIVFSLLFLILGFWFSYKHSLITLIGANFYSFAVHFFVMLSFLCLCVGMGIELSNTQLISNYLLLFIISALFSATPLTIGRVAVSELVFLFGAVWLGLDKEMAVALSLQFLLVTLVVSMLGAAMQHRLSTYETKKEEGVNLPPHE